MSRNAKNSREEWLDAGLRILAEQGRNGLTLQELVRRMEVTKGAFYHHFSAFGEFRSRMLERFELVGTHQLIAQAQNRIDPELHPAAVIEHLVNASERADPGAERILRAWALEDPEVRATIERVDGARLEYGHRLCLTLTGNRERAEGMVQVLYALLVGADQLDSQGRLGMRSRVYAEFKRLHGIA
jgi:AcrR family transcriptional regulator